MRAGVPTYLVPDASVVVVDPWVAHDHGTIGDRIEHWDPATDLALRRRVTVDLDAIREQCGLGARSTFALTASWHASTRTRLSGAGPRVDLGDLTGTVRASLSLEIPGAETGGRVDIITNLVLRAPHAASPISPRRLGAILWSDRTQVWLEGAASRFPTAAVDFGSVDRIPSGAAWYLDWDPRDMSRPVMGGLRLLLNESNERLIRAVRSGSRDPASAAVRAFILVDVARQIVRAAVENDDFVSSPDSYEPDSIGRMVRDLISMVWPQTTIQAVRTRALTEPSRFEADIQTALDFLS